MRVRIRRFGELRLALGKTRDSERVEVGARQSNLERFVCGHVPPASAETSGDAERSALNTTTLQLVIHRSSPLPLFEHEHPHSSMKPLIHLREMPGVSASLKYARQPTRKL